MVPSGSQTCTGLRQEPLESGGIDMRNYLLEEDFIDRVRQQDKDTFDILCKADNLRQIVSLISVRPNYSISDSDSPFRIFQVVGELFEIRDIKPILLAFLGESERKTESIDSLFRDSDTKIEEDGQQLCQSPDKTAVSPYLSRNSLQWNSECMLESNCTINDEVEKLFFVSNNILVDFVEILRLDNLDDPYVQHYFNKVFTALLNFRPEAVQTMILEKHKLHNLLTPAFKLISDFEVADVIEKICFHTYLPSEKVSEDYLQQTEPQVISLLTELLGLVTQNSDELEIQSLCKIFKACLQKMSIHKGFEKFANLIFTPKRIQQFLDVLINTKNPQVKAEIAVFLKTGVQVVLAENTEGKKRLNTKWLPKLSNEFRRIKENILENNDRSRTVMMQFQQTVPIFGSERQAIIELIMEIIKLDNSIYVSELIMQDIPRTIFSFLFQFEWNNLLHEQIYLFIEFLVQSAINSAQDDYINLSSNSIAPNLKLLIHMVTDVEIFRQLRKLSNEDTIMLEVKQICLQRPNIAFVIKISQTLQKFRQNCPEIDQYLSDTQKEKWIEFCDCFLKKKLDIQGIKLGEYDKEKEKAEMKRISDELAKNVVNQSKLSERYRKNSGKGTNLFILNPSNKKKFSTGVLGGIKPKMSAEFDDFGVREQTSSLRSRRKGFCSEEMSSSSLLSCLDEGSVGQILKGIEKKRDELNSSSSSSLNIVHKTSPQKGTIEEKQNEADRLQKSDKILTELDDSWEQSQKRIITFTNQNGGGISFNETFKKKSEDIKETGGQEEVEKEKQNNQGHSNETSDISSIFFKRKERNKSMSTRTFGATLLETIKNKKYSYDETNTKQHILLSQTLLKRRSRVKSQPNLSSKQNTFLESSSDLFDQLPPEDPTLQIRTLHSADDNLNLKNNNKIIQKTTVPYSSIQSKLHKIDEENNCTNRYCNFNLQENNEQNKISNETLSTSTTTTTSNSIESPQDTNGILDQYSKEFILSTPPAKRAFQKSRSIETGMNMRTNLFRQYPDRTCSFNRINEEENDSHSETEISASHSKSDGSAHDFTLESIDSLSPQRQLAFEIAKKEQLLKSPISSFSLFGDSTQKEEIGQSNNLFSPLEEEKRLSREQIIKRRRKTSMSEPLENEIGLDRFSSTKGSFDMETSESSSSSCSCSSGGFQYSKNIKISKGCCFMSDRTSCSSDSQDSQQIILKEKRSSCPNEAIFLINKSDKLSQKIDNSQINISSQSLENTNNNNHNDIDIQETHFH